MSVITRMFERLRSAPHAGEPAQRAPAAATDWTTLAGAEFAGLSESERCDLAFAFAGVEGRHASDVLVRALEDPSEAVALAAAHALSRRGESAALSAYMRTHPGDRSERLARTLELLD